MGHQFGARNGRLRDCGMIICNGEVLTLTLRLGHLVVYFFSGPKDRPRTRGQAILPRGHGSHPTMVASRATPLSAARNNTAVAIFFVRPARRGDSGAPRPPTPPHALSERCGDGPG